MPAEVAVESRDVPARVDLADEPGLRQLLEVAIHGAQADAGQAAASLAVDPIGRGVVHGRADDGQHELALPAAPRFASLHKSVIIPIYGALSSEKQRALYCPRGRPRRFRRRPDVPEPDPRGGEGSRSRGAIRAERWSSSWPRPAGSGLVIVDLDSARLPTGAALAALKADPALATLPVVGFFSHVHAERAEAARQAGVGRVLARSAFVQALPALLAESTAPA